SPRRSHLSGTSVLVLDGDGEISFSMPTFPSPSATVKLRYEKGKRVGVEAILSTLAGALGGDDGGQDHRSPGSGGTVGIGFLSDGQRLVMQTLELYDEGGET